jgi:hypothetical protein
MKSFTVITGSVRDVTSQIDETLVVGHAESRRLVSTASRNAQMEVVTWRSSEIPTGV